MTPHSCCRNKDHDLQVRGLVFKTGFGLCNGKSSLMAFQLTSLSSPAATVTMSPVSLLIVNIFCDGLCGV